VLFVFSENNREVISFQAISIVGYGWSKKAGPAMLV